VAINQLPKPKAVSNTSIPIQSAIIGLTGPLLSTPTAFVSPQKRNAGVPVAVILAVDLKVVSRVGQTKGLPIHPTPLIPATTVAAAVAVAGTCEYGPPYDKLSKI
jgi:hypothetical protein